MEFAATARFEALRSRMASLAYRLLGSAADAEDVVQDAFLRWQAADRDYVEVPEAWLTKVVTNLALDRLRSAHARRERAVGSWLPEPLLEGDPMLGPLDTVEQRESVSIAVLLLLERLSPVERAVYVLKEAFSYSHKEIAQILDITESASQQHAHRARRHVATERRAGEIDRAAARDVVEAFLAAAASGSTERLVALLTEDATALTDRAGLMEEFAEITVLERIASLIRASFKPTDAKRRLVGGSPSIYIEFVNGMPAAVAELDGRIVGAGVFEVRDGKVAALIGLANAKRLNRLTAQWGERTHGDPLIQDW
jgi:RNA polymerase sigma factor (sigma-70 family)